MVEGKGLTHTVLADTEIYLEPQAAGQALTKKEIGSEIEEAQGLSQQRVKDLSDEPLTRPKGQGTFWFKPGPET